MILLAPLVAFGFANLAMLGWLAAAAAPILIHLWMRQTRRETAWAAVRFLQAALERQARKLRLQHWVLLAIRTLLLVCVALAAAKPFLDQAGALATFGAGVHHVMVFDTSLSMALTGDDGSRLDRVRRVAEEVVTSAGAADRFSVVAMSGDPRVVLAESSDRNAVRRAVGELSPSHGVADIGGALALVDRLLGVEGDDTPRLARDQQARLLFLTDLDEAAWTPVGDEGSPERASLDRLAGLMPMKAIDAAESASVANAAIALVEYAPGLATIREPVSVQATVVLHNGESQTESAVELLVDDAVVASQPVSLSPGRPSTAVFSYRLSDAGERALAVRLADDSLPRDNTRWCVAPVRERIEVLVVEGARDAGRFVADALNPGVAPDSAVRVRRVTDADLRRAKLDTVACVFCCNVGEFGPEEAERLRRFVRGGGGLVVFLGDRVNEEAYNRELGAGAAGGQGVTQSRGGGAVRFASATLGQREPKLLPTEIGPAVSQPSYRVDPLDYAHPIAAPFRGQERAGLLTTPVMRHHPLTIADGGGPGDAAVALALANGDPLVVTSTFGRGRVALVPTAASLASVDPATGGPWTAWPAWPSFLPVVRGLMEYTASGDTKSRSLLVDDPIVVEGAVSTPPIVVTPSGDEVEATATDDGWRFSATDAGGVYRVRGDGVERSFAVNVDPAESSLQAVSRGALPASLEVVAATDWSRSAGGTSTTTPLHRLLLYAALFLALIETVLACLFGRGSA